MKISCDIIKDLLPLYHDKVCSEESRVMVDEHIKECDSCAKQLDDISDELARPINAIDDAKPIKAIQNAWKKDKSKSFFKGTIIAVFVCAVLVGCFVGLTQLRVLPIKADMLEVSDVSRLSDGRIVFLLNIKDNIEAGSLQCRSDLIDGVYNMTPMRTIIGKERSLESARIGLYEYYLVIDVAELEANEDGTPITSCYIGPKDNGILLWENGMELPPASDELEARFSTSK